MSMLPLIVSFMSLKQVILCLRNAFVQTVEIIFNQHERRNAPSGRANTLQTHFHFGERTDKEIADLIPRCLTISHMQYVPALHSSYMMLTLSEIFKPKAGCTIPSIRNTLNVCTILSKFSLK